MIIAIVLFISRDRFVMELSSTLRDVRDALDRLDEALHRENVLIASTKDSISDSKAKEATLNVFSHSTLISSTSSRLGANPSWLGRVRSSPTT